jgi:hypothetical protein
MTRDGQELGVEGYVNVSGRYRMQVRTPVLLLFKENTEFLS